MKNIKYLGKLVTERTIFRPTQNMPCVELDENKYLGYTDWELECEVKNNIDLCLLEKWLKQVNIKLLKPERGKYRRFIDLLKTFRE